MQRRIGQPWIGCNIAGVREYLGWTQDELAEAVTAYGLPMRGRTVGKIERGERKRVTAEEVAAIAAVLGVPLSEITEGPTWAETANYGPRVRATLASALGGWLPSYAEAA